MKSEKVILLIEDNPSDVDLTERALTKSRLANELISVEDGESALEYLGIGANQASGYEPELPALILLDINLPKVTGLEVLSRIRANPRTRRLPVVILTSSKEEQDIATGYDLGVNSYIRKPVDFKQFAGCIEQLGLYWLVWNEQPPEVK